MGKRAVRQCLSSKSALTTVKACIDATARVRGRRIKIRALIQLSFFDADF
jgi:hypothetical protein